MGFAGDDARRRPSSQGGMTMMLDNSALERAHGGPLGSPRRGWRCLRDSPVLPFPVASVAALALALRLAWQLGAFRRGCCDGLAQGGTMTSSVAREG